MCAGRWRKSWASIGLQKKNVPAVKQQVLENSVPQQANPAVCCEMSGTSVDAQAAATSADSAQSISTSRSVKLSEVHAELLLSFKHRDTITNTMAQLTPYIGNLDLDISKLKSTSAEIQTMLHSLRDMVKQLDDESECAIAAQRAKVHHTQCLMCTSIISKMVRSRSVTPIQVILSAYLDGAGIPQACLDALQSFGITTTYDTIHDEVTKVSRSITKFSAHGNCVLSIDNFGFDVHTNYISETRRGKHVETITALEVSAPSLPASPVNITLDLQNCVEWANSQHLEPEEENRRCAAMWRRALDNAVTGRSVSHPQAPPLIFPKTKAFVLPPYIQDCIIGITGRAYHGSLGNRENLQAVLDDFIATYIEPGLLTQIVLLGDEQTVESIWCVKFSNPERYTSRSSLSNTVLFSIQLHSVDSTLTASVADAHQRRCTEALWQSQRASRRSL